jgi:hypothetical protein
MFVHWFELHTVTQVVRIDEVAWRLVDEISPGWRARWREIRYAWLVAEVA